MSGGPPAPQKKPPSRPASILDDLLSGAQPPKKPAGAAKSASIAKQAAPVPPPNPALNLMDKIVKRQVEKGVVAFRKPKTLDETKKRKREDEDDESSGTSPGGSTDLEGEDESGEAGKELEPDESYDSMEVDDLPPDAMVSGTRIPIRFLAEYKEGDAFVIDHGKGLEEEDVEFEDEENDEIGLTDEDLALRRGRKAIESINSIAAGEGGPVEEIKLLIGELDDLQDNSATFDKNCHDLRELILKLPVVYDYCKRLAQSFIVGKDKANGVYTTKSVATGQNPIPCKNLLICVQAQGLSVENGIDMKKIATGLKLREKLEPLATGKGPAFMISAFDPARLVLDPNNGSGDALMDKKLNLDLKRLVGMGGFYLIDSTDPPAERPEVEYRLGLTSDTLSLLTNGDSAFVYDKPDGAAAAVTNTNNLPPGHLFYLLPTHLFVDFMKSEINGGLFSRLASKYTAIEFSTTTGGTALDVSYKMSKMLTNLISFVPKIYFNMYLVASRLAKQGGTFIKLSKDSSYFAHSSYVYIIIRTIDLKKVQYLAELDQMSDNQFVEEFRAAEEEFFRLVPPGAEGLSGNVGDFPFLNGLTEPVVVKPGLRLIPFSVSDASKAEMDEASAIVYGSAGGEAKVQEAAAAAAATAPVVETKPKPEPTKLDAKREKALIELMEMQQTLTETLNKKRREERLEAGKVYSAKNLELERYKQQMKRAGFLDHLEVENKIKRLEENAGLLREEASTEIWSLRDGLDKGYGQIDEAVRMAASKAGYQKSTEFLAEAAKMYKQLYDYIHKELPLEIYRTPRNKFTLLKDASDSINQFLLRFSKILSAYRPKGAQLGFLDDTLQDPDYEDAERLRIARDTEEQAKFMTALYAQQNLIFPDNPNYWFINNENFPGLITGDVRVVDKVKPYSGDPRSIKDMTKEIKNVELVDLSIPGTTLSIESPYKLFIMQTESFIRTVLDLQMSAKNAQTKWTSIITEATDVEAILVKLYSRAQGLQSLERVLESPELPEQAKRLVKLWIKDDLIGFSINVGTVYNNQVTDVSEKIESVAKEYPQPPTAAASTNDLLFNVKAKGSNDIPDDLNFSAPASKKSKRAGDRDRVREVDSEFVDRLIKYANFFVSKRGDLEVSNPNEGMEDDDDEDDDEDAEMDTGESMGEDGGDQQQQPLPMVNPPVPAGLEAQPNSVSDEQSIKVGINFIVKKLDEIPAKLQTLRASLAKADGLISGAYLYLNRNGLVDPILENLIAVRRNSYNELYGQLIALRTLANRSLRFLQTSELAESQELRDQLIFLKQKIKEAVKSYKELVNKYEWAKVSKWFRTANNGLIKWVKDEFTGDLIQRFAEDIEGKVDVLTASGGSTDAVNRELGFMIYRLIFISNVVLQVLFVPYDTSAEPLKGILASVAKAKAKVDQAIQGPTATAIAPTRANPRENGANANETEEEEVVAVQDTLLTDQQDSLQTEPEMAELPPVDVQEEPQSTSSDNTIEGVMEDLETEEAVVEENQKEADPTVVVEEDTLMVTGEEAPEPTEDEDVIVLPPDESTTTTTTTTTTEDLQPTQSNASSHGIKRDYEEMSGSESGSSSSDSETEASASYFSDGDDEMAARFALY